MMIRGLRRSIERLRNVHRCVICNRPSTTGDYCSPGCQERGQRAVRALHAFRVEDPDDGSRIVRLLPDGDRR